MTPTAGRATSPVFEFDGFRLDRQLRSVHRAGERLALSPKPFATLEYLIENRHRVVPKTELLEKVWGGQREISTVEHAVGHVRRVLADDLLEPRYIETVPGQGYRFIGALSEQNLPDRKASSHRAILITIAAVLTLLFAGLAAMRMLRPRPRVARMDVDGKALVAREANGNVIWIHLFPAPLVPPQLDPSAPQTQILDLDGDGISEILVVPRYATRTPQDLYCFSSSGKIEWKWRPAFDAAFRARPFGGPWRFLDVLAVPGNPAGAIWVALVHDIWWPSFIMRLSASGVAERMFTNSGNIRKLSRIRNRTGSYILAAGVNNEYKRASLAILREDAGPCTSPQTEDSEYQCIRGCSGSPPYEYILLPRSELNTAGSAPYNIATVIDLRSDGFTVETDEQQPGTRAFYDFSMDLQPQRVAYSDSYREVHQRFENEGRIHHTYANCPERKSPATLRICDQNGRWTQVAVPRTATSN